MVFLATRKSSLSVYSVFPRPSGRTYSTPRAMRKQITSAFMMTIHINTVLISAWAVRAWCKVEEEEEEMLASSGIQTTTSTIRMSKTRFDASICAYYERQQRQQQQPRRKKQTSSDVIERVLDGLLAVQRRAIVGRVVNSVVVVPHAIFLVSALSSRAHATLGRFSLTKIVPTPLTLIHSRPLVNRVTGQTQSCRSRNCTFRGALAQTHCRAGCA